MHSLNGAEREYRGLNPLKAAVSLRKAFDVVIQAAMVAKEALGNQRAERRNVNTSSTTSPVAPAKGASATRNPSSPTSKTPAKSDRPKSTVKVTTGTVEISGMTSVVSAGPSLGAGRRNSKVESLQRQLEALTARHQESEIAAKAANSAAVVDLFIKPGRERESGANERRLQTVARRCVELEDKVKELEGERMDRTAGAARDLSTVSSGSWKVFVGLVDSNRLSQHPPLQRFGTLEPILPHL